MKQKILIFGLLLALLWGCAFENASFDNATEGSRGPPEETVSPAQTETGAASPEESVSAPGTPTCIMSYNIYYKDVQRRQAAIWRLVGENDPDILLLQEVTGQWLPSLLAFAEEKGYICYGYGSKTGIAIDAPGADDAFTPLLWKKDRYDTVDSGYFWLSSTPDVPSTDWFDGTTSWYFRCTNWAILKDKVTGRELFISNAHLDPEKDAVRLLSCRLLLEKSEQLGEGRPVILGGDWNLTLSSAGYALLTGEGGLADARILAEDADLGGSFNDWGDRKEGNFAYGDHIFLSPELTAAAFRVVDDRVDGVHISDHNPLLTVVYYP